MKNIRRGVKEATVRNDICYNHGYTRFFFHSLSLHKCKQSSVLNYTFVAQVAAPSNLNALAGRNRAEIQSRICKQLQSVNLSPYHLPEVAGCATACGGTFSHPLPLLVAWWTPVANSTSEARNIVNDKDVRVASFVSGLGFYYIKLLKDLTTRLADWPG